MTIDFPTLLITALFVSQIAVCSFFSAHSFTKVNKLMLERCPPQQYPKLYPLGAEKLQQHHTLRMALRMGIASVGILVLIVSLTQHASAIELSDRMIWVAMAQALPTLLLIPHLLSVAKALKAMPPPAVRSAELRALRVTDFVSSVSIVLAIGASVVPVLLAVWFALHGAPSGSTRQWIMAIFPALLLARMLYVLLAPVPMARPDPYMSDPDLFRARQLRMRLLFGMAIYMGIYCALLQLWVAGLLHIDRVFINACVSLLVQFFSLRMSGLLRRDLETRDFTPYRAGPATGST